MPSIINTVQKNYEKISDTCTAIKTLVSQHAESELTAAIQHHLVALDGDVSSGSQQIAAMITVLQRDQSWAKRQDQEDDGSYADRLLLHLSEMESSIKSIKEELDYQKRCHQACHNEVYKLRQALQAMTGKSQDLNSYAFLRLKNKVAAKLKRYMDFMTTLSEGLADRIGLLKAAQVSLPAETERELSAICDSISRMRKSIGSDIKALHGNWRACGN